MQENYNYAAIAKSKNDPRHTNCLPNNSYISATLFKNGFLTKETHTTSGNFENRKEITLHVENHDAPKTLKFFFTRNNLYKICAHKLTDAQTGCKEKRE